jgi:hypothetical protein
MTLKIPVVFPVAVMITAANEKGVLPAVPVNGVVVNVKVIGVAMAIVEKIAPSNALWIVLMLPPSSKCAKTF